MRRAASVVDFARLGLAVGCLALVSAPVSAQSSGKEPAIPLKAATQELIEFALDCHRRFGPGAAAPASPSGPRTWFGPLAAGGSTPAAGAGGQGPRLVIIGIDERTGIERADRIAITRFIEQNISRDRRVPLYDPAEQNFNLDAVHRAFGMNAMDEVRRQIRLQPGDLIFRAEGENTRRDTVAVNLVLMTPNGDCKSTTRTEEVPRTNRLPTARDLIVDAAKQLTERFGQRVRRIAVVPTVRDTTPLPPQAVADLETQLVDVLREKVKFMAPPQDAVTGDGRTQSKLSIVRMGRLEFFTKEAEAGDWIAQMRISPKDGGAEMLIEIAEAVSNDLVTLRAGVAADSLGAVDLKGTIPPIGLIAEQPTISAPRERFGFKLRAVAPSSLYCAIQDFDGQTFLIFPTVATQRNRFFPPREPSSAGLVSFPADFDAPLPLAFDKPGRTLVRCLTVPDGLTGESETRWRTETPHERKRRASSNEFFLTGAEYAALVNRLKQTNTIYETLAVIKVTGPPSQKR